MLSQFNNKILNSFYLWFQNKLTDSSLKAYRTNMDNTFTLVGAIDSEGDWVAYQGKYRQLVPEEDVDVPNSGVFVDGTFFSGDSSSIYIDYNEGRIIVPENLGDVPITANNTVSEVNIYLTNDDPVSLLTHSDFVVSGAEDDPYLYTKTATHDDKVYMIPACFISVESMDNEPICFGGEEVTSTNVRVFVVADSTYILDGLISFFSDTAREDITLIPDDDFPFGVFFSIKNFPYNYDGLVESQNATGSSIAHIRKVTGSKVDNNRLAPDIDKSLSIGFLDFELTTNRFPRL